MDTLTTLANTYALLWGEAVGAMVVAGNERGFALLAVTVVLAVLALILGAVALSSRMFVHDSIDTLDRVRLDAALDAGTVTAAHDLAGPMAPSLHYLHAPEGFQVGDIAVSVSARPETAKVDLNTADPMLLAALLRVSGVPRSRAEQLADEIADWRDVDAVARPHGAESADYLAAGRKDAPANAPFETVSELARILDGNADLATCLTPDVTVYSRQKSVDLADASERVRHAVELADPRSKPAPMLPTAAGAFLAPNVGIYEVNITAKSAATGASRTRQVVVRITGSPDRPYWILAEASPAPDQGEAQVACARFAARN
jgi:general secretion pathway protein K